MAFEPENIKKEHILRAVEIIQKEEPELKPNARWNVVINGKKYPPKTIMRLAHLDMT
tara:strand:+ start:592 stop:762 length:171 start_codon:yes stop_codon:yes gene_type:complete